MSTGRSRYSNTRLKSAIELVSDTDRSSRPISGRNSVPCSAVKATRVPMVMPPDVAGNPAAR
jgi:hypothetical protein